MYASSSFIKYLKENPGKTPVTFFPSSLPAPNLNQMKSFMGEINDLIVHESSIENEVIDHAMIEFLRKSKIPEYLLKNQSLVNSAKTDLSVGKEPYDDGVHESVLDCPIAAYAGKGDVAFSPDQEILQLHVQYSRIP